MTDLMKPIGPPTDDTPPAPLWRRLLWFAGLALVSVAAVAVAAYILKALLFIG